MAQQQTSLFKKQILGLGVSAFALAMLMANGDLAAQEVAALQPKSGWNLKSDTSTASGYCALSRAFDEDVILTLGQNQTQEYSLAIDFQKAKLDPDKAYPVTLQPGPSQIRAYEMMPASARAMVIRLGYDESFFKALETSKMLKAEINNIKYNFQIPDAGQGQVQLNDCMAKLKGDAPVQTANKFKAEKIEEAEKIVKPEQESNKTEVAEVKTEPKPIEIKSVELAKPKEEEIVPVKQAVVEVEPVEAKAPKEITIERVGQKVIPIASKPEVKPQVEPVEINQAKIEDIKEEFKEEITPAVTPPEVKVAAIAPSEAKLQRPTSSARDARLERKEVISPKSTINLKSTSLVDASTPKPTSKPKMAQTTAEKAKMEAPITDEMKAAPKPFSPSVPKVVLDTDAPKARPIEVTREEKIVPDLQLAKTDAEKQVEAEKVKIKTEAIALDQKQQKIAQEMKAQEDRLSALNEEDSTNDIEIRNIREEIAILRIENKKLYEEAEKARRRLDSVAIESGNQAMRRIREYERKLEAAKSDNITLSRELEEMQRLKEDGRLTQVSGDKSMTQTVERYNEAEREIKRLGLLLEQQRAAHRAEKTELEEMLFDPAVTNRAQRDKLADLENKLAEAQAQLRERAPTSSTQVARQPKAPIPVVRETVAPKQIVSEKIVKEVVPAKSNADDEIETAQNQNKQMQVSMSEKPQANLQAERNNIKIQELNKKLEIQNKQLQVYQRQIAMEKQRAMLAEQQAAKVAQKNMADEIIAKQAAAAKQETAIEPLRISKPKAPSSTMMSKGSTANTFGEAQVRNLLQQGGVIPQTGVDKTASGEYQWRVGEIRGAAKVAHTSQTPSMESFIKGYVANMKQACNGDFASLPADQRNSYEIACVGGMTNTSSSVVFTQKDGHYIAISHITTPDNMDMAMDARDRIANQL